MKRQREEDAQRRRIAADISEARAQVKLFRRQLGAIKQEIARRRAAAATASFKYSPNQPRVPAGRNGGGRWTDRSSGGGTGGGSGGIFGALSAISEGLGLGDGLGSPLGDIDFGDLSWLGEFEDLFPITPDDLDFEGIQLAQNDGRSGYPVDLLEELELGGHTIEGHVNRSSEALLARVRREALTAQDYGFADGIRVGSFPSLEAANKLVNATIAQNPTKIDRIVNGVSPTETLNAQFSSVTGSEAFARNDRSQPYIRDTYGVSVVVVPNAIATKRYRVETAFPRNFDR